ncbi:DinB family protein [Actinosynnema sp. NPDC023587]|uniref:DinB family protein n=1 Tax=Actinosynnema sp. NPDC023587 TaxID=3154695 RepID=UPI0033E131F9
MGTKSDLHHYLEQARRAVVWKLDGLSEYDIRRPLTPTGTNLLGLVKHLAVVESGYLGSTFGRPYPEDVPALADDAEPNADMWATADESRDDIIALYQRVRAHSDTTVAALDLDAEGDVPWWPEARRKVTLGLVLIHLIAETHRHAGHADIVRELVDGEVGHRPEVDNMAEGDRQWWQHHHARLDRTARSFGGA